MALNLKFVLMTITDMQLGNIESLVASVFVVGKGVEHCGVGGRGNVSGGEWV